MNPGRAPPTSSAMQQGPSMAPRNARQGSGSRGSTPNEGDDISTGARSEWRREEHGRFMQALEMYGSRRTGDEWKHIAAFVGSRTVEEVLLHGQQYLQRLVQQLPPSPDARRFLSVAGSQNDPNRLNYQVPRPVELQKASDGGKGKRTATQSGVPIRGETSALSAAALECAQAMNVQGEGHFHTQPQPLQPRRNGRRSRGWTFQEDKAFETVLAGWVGNKPFSWAKIAAALPGKTPKEVRTRYDEMVGEVASIEAGEMPQPFPDSSFSPSTSTLSRRAVPPPPIEVPPRNVGKDAFPSGRSTRSRRGSGSGIMMLSPTFLDLLANEAESEDKSPLPTLSFPGLPSPLFSPTLLPSGPPGFFSPGNKKSAARGQQDKKLAMDEIDTGPAGKSDDPRRSSTPRIWNDFLAEDFKFDDPLGATPSHSIRKTPCSKTASSSDKPSTTEKSESDDVGKQDVDMTDTSAA